MITSTSGGVRRLRSRAAGLGISEQQHWSNGAQADSYSSALPATIVHIKQPFTKQQQQLLHTFTTTSKWDANSG